MSLHEKKTFSAYTCAFLADSATLVILCLRCSLRRQPLHCCKHAVPVASIQVELLPAFHTMSIIFALIPILDEKGRRKMFSTASNDSTMVGFFGFGWIYLSNFRDVDSSPSGPPQEALPKGRNFRQDK